MTRSQLLFVILLNAIISFAIALAVAWIDDARRPDPERLAASFTPTPRTMPLGGPLRKIDVSRLIWRP